MNEIAERIGLCKHCLTDETRYCHSDCQLYSKYRGATEQFAIDKEKADVACGNSYRNGYYDAIDKACEWLRWIMKNGSSYGEFPSEESIKDFRKAMEE